MVENEQSKSLVELVVSSPNQIDFYINEVDFNNNNKNDVFDSNMNYPDEQGFE